jgi:hypothetical protein
MKLKLYQKVLITLFSVDIVAFLFTLIIQIYLHGGNSKAPEWLNAWGVFGFLTPLAIGMVACLTKGLAMLWRK